MADDLGADLDELLPQGGQRPVLNVRFSLDYVCFAPGSGRSRGPCRTSAADPKRKLLTLPEKLIKIGANVVRHGRYITFQLAEVAIPRSLFANILRLIDGLRPAPLPP